jgi:hypothetical protein
MKTKYPMLKKCNWQSTMKTQCKKYRFGDGACIKPTHCRFQLKLEVSHD